MATQVNLKIDDNLVMALDLHIGKQHARQVREYLVQHPDAESLPRQISRTQFVVDLIRKEIGS